MENFGSENLPVFICSHIFNNTRPILFVSRAGGDWQFLCGEKHEINENPKIVSIGHLIEQDPTLNEIANLPVNWEAERTGVGDQWVKMKCRDYAYN